jgi:HD-like signal output (HDOD) protein
MKRSVLFVDDEPRVLEGLQRMLRVMRREWQMVFAESGQKALDILSQGAFDVVISGMVMPGLDGAQLLTEVQNRYPHIVRIVLSGQSDDETSLKSVLPAHQYLSKPCDAETLKHTVGRACTLRDLVTNERLKGVVSQMGSLPSLPSLYAEMMEALQSAETSIQKIGEIISKDIGMTAKILQLVNSAFFGLCQSVSSPTQAASLLGLETIKALVLSVQIFSEFDPSGVPQFSPEMLWKHSMRTGVTAKAIANKEKTVKDVVDDAFMAGLLHDSGKLVLGAKFPEKYGKVIALAEGENISLCEAESDMFETTHAEVGAYLMGLWGLPNAIVETLAFHHTPGQSFGKRFSPLTAVHVANALDHEGHILDGEETGSAIDLDYLEKLGLSDRLVFWLDRRQQVLNGGGD